MGEREELNFVDCQVHISITKLSLISNLLLIVTEIVWYTQYTLLQLRQRYYAECPNQ